MDNTVHKLILKKDCIEKAILKLTYKLGVVENSLNDEAVVEHKIFNIL
jgi:hypothetical protein